MPTVLISSGPLRKQPGRFREILVEAGLETFDPDGEYQFVDEDLRTLLPAVDAVIAGGEPYSASLLAVCPRLKIIARTGVGYDAVDTAAATRHGIAVTTTPGTNHDSVAEQTFALLFGVLRRVAFNDRIIRSRGWDRTLPAPLRGQTMGLVGLGRIGRAMIPRAHAFGVNVIAYDPLATDPATLATQGVTLVDFPTLLEQSDIVSLHCPLTPETRHWFNKAVIARMKPGSVLLNTSRGGVVVESDLHDALVAHHLAGAGLDVLDREPPDPKNPLLQLDNVVTSPHIAGIDTRAMADMAEKAAQCIVEHLAGRPPRDCIMNPEVLS